MGNSGWVEKLKARWKLRTAGQVALILVVFACTGTTVLLIKKPITLLVTSEDESQTLFTILYWILVFPVYNLLLLVYGLIFGQFKFFWEYEKKFFRRLLGKTKKEAKAPFDIKS